MKILIIEDEYELSQAIGTFLSSGNYIVEKATDYDSGMEKVLLYEYDCILLDISLPGGNGLKIMEEMKKAGIKSNVIVISAKDSVEDKIKGLDLGADDYLAKPFHLTELHARIKAVLRRKLQDGQDILTLGNLAIDIDKRLAFVNDTELRLTKKEFDILYYFAINIDRPITKEILAEHIWGDNIDMADSFDFIYSQVKNLRKRLKDASADVTLKNVYGIGYKMVL